MEESKPQQIRNSLGQRRRGRPKKTMSEANGYFSTRPELSENDGLATELLQEITGNESDIVSINVSDKRAEKVARGYFVGQHAVGRRKDVRKVLEDRVIGKIGKSGKLLTDKLFELIEGVYIVDKLKNIQGKEEVRYYKVPPNLNAIIYALDRVLGKPKQLSVQANFSLSSLLIQSQDGNGKRTELRRGE